MYNDTYIPFEDPLSVTNASVTITLRSYEFRGESDLSGVLYSFIYKEEFRRVNGPVSLTMLNSSESLCRKYRTMLTFGSVTIVVT